MSDEIKRLRLVGYQEDKQEKVAQITNDGEPIVLSNCCVKQARSGDGLEVIVTNKTEINK